MRPYVLLAESCKKVIQILTHGGNFVSRLLVIVIGVAAFTLAACGDYHVFSRVSTPKSYRLDLGPGLVAAFVKSQSGARSGKVAYVTHVPSGSQAVVDRDGRIIERHDGRGDGPSRLDEVFGEKATMKRIIRGIQSDREPRSNQWVVIEWVPLFQFGSIKYVSNWVTKEDTLTGEDLTEFYRVAFKADGNVGLGYRIQDGDETYLSPGTPVYAFEDYAPEFRLGIVQDGIVTIYEADTNPNAKVSEDLLDIRGMALAIDILSDEYAATVLGTIQEDRAVYRIVELILASPVDQGSHDRGGERFILDFRLADGMSLVRPFWLETGELWRGIMTGPAVAQSLRSAVALQPQGTAGP